MTAQTATGAETLPAASILIVDDMEANRAVLCRRLERHNFSIASVASGAAALDHLQHALPDLILLDYMMPEMNGIEVLRQLRARARTMHIPVIMVTARAESEATIEALEAGADDYVTKPIDFDVLRARIATHLTKQTSATNLERANAALDERVTRRSLALADLEEELREEIERRQKLEQQLAEAGTGGAIPSGPPSDAALVSVLETISDRFDFVFDILASGRAPNLAQMAELKALVEDAKRLAGGE